MSNTPQKQTKRKAEELQKSCDGPSNNAMFQLLNAISKINASGKGSVSPVTVVLAGAQSTAKSSTINAFSGNRTCPTSMGTCTKFPLKYVVQKSLSEKSKPCYKLALPNGNPQEFEKLEQVQSVIDNYQKGLRNINYSNIGMLVVESNDVVPMVIYDLPGAVTSTNDNEMANACLQIDGKETDIVIINTSPKDFVLQTDRTLTAILKKLEEKSYKKKILINVTQIDKIFGKEFETTRKSILADMVLRLDELVPKESKLDVTFAVCQTFFGSEMTPLAEVAQEEERTLSSDEFTVLRQARRNGKPLFMFGIPQIQTFIWNGIIANLDSGYVKLVESDIDLNEENLKKKLDKKDIKHLPSHMAKEVSMQIENSRVEGQIQMQLENTVMIRLIEKTNSFYKNARDERMIPVPSNQETPRVLWSISTVRKETLDACDVEKHDQIARKIFADLRLYSSSIAQESMAIIDEHVKTVFSSYAEHPKLRKWLAQTYENFKTNTQEFNLEKLSGKIYKIISDQSIGLNVIQPKEFNTKLWSNEHDIVRERANNSIIAMLVDTLHVIFPFIARSVMLEVSRLALKKYAIYLNSVMTKTDEVIAETTEEEKAALELEKISLKHQREALESIKEIIADAAAKKQKTGEKSSFFGWW